MTPSELVRDLLDGFKPQDPREMKIHEALRELVALQRFESGGEMQGPRLSVASVAKRAGLWRNLVSLEDCELPAARTLLLGVLRRLSEYSLQVECDYLREENKRLEACLERQGSLLANRIVAMHREKTMVQPTEKGRWTAKDVRNAVKVVPMSEL